jgi:hypothetical protein
MPGHDAGPFPPPMPVHAEPRVRRRSCRHGTHAAPRARWRPLHPRPRPPPPASPARRPASSNRRMAAGSDVADDDRRRMAEPPCAKRAISRKLRPRYNLPGPSINHRQRKDVDHDQPQKQPQSNAIGQPVRLMLVYADGRVSHRDVDQGPRAVEHVAPAGDAPAPTRCPTRTPRLPPVRGRNRRTPRRLQPARHARPRRRANASAASSSRRRK